MTDKEKVKLIQEITKELIKQSVRDHNGKHNSEQDRAVELLSRALHDFSELYVNDKTDHDEVLKGIIAKVKIAYNTMDRIKKPNIVIKRV